MKAIDRLIEVFLFSFLALCLGGLVTLPFLLYQSSVQSVKVVNEACGTNYTAKEFFFAEGTIREVCQFQNQSLTIK